MTRRAEAEALRAALARIGYGDVPVMVRWRRGPRGLIEHVSVCPSPEALTGEDCWDALKWAAVDGKSAGQVVAVIETERRRRTEMIARVRADVAKLVPGEVRDLDGTLLGWRMIRQSALQGAGA